MRCCATPTCAGSCARAAGMGSRGCWPMWIRRRSRAIRGSWSGSRMSPRCCRGRRRGACGGGEVTARLLPGNLTLFAHLIGSPWQLDAEGAILVTEEVTEKPYAIDRYLTQLQHAGVLRGCRGAVIGDLTKCMDPAWVA